MPYFKTLTKENGGHVIKAFESPTGEDIEPGTVFEASANWYRERQRCPWLQSATPDEFDAFHGEGSEDSEAAPDLDDMTKKELVELAESEGVEPDGDLKDDYLDALKAHYSA